MHFSAHTNQNELKKKGKNKELIWFAIIVISKQFRNDILIYKYWAIPKLVRQMLLYPAQTKHLIDIPDCQIGCIKKVPLNELFSNLATQNKVLV